MMDSLLTSIKRQPIAQLLLAVTFLTSGLIINLMQGFLYVFIRPFSKYLFRKLNYYPNYWLHAQLVFTAEWWGNLDVTVYSGEGELDQFFGKEHAYCIMNHRYEIDWLVGFVFCDRIRLLGNCKTYAKKSIQYVPLLGWGWKFAESVFLDRSWERDKEIIGRQVTELADYPDPMWLLLTAEGTRFTPAKHEASQKFARDKGLAVLKHHLTPRTKGFTYSVPYIRDKVPAIYDVQLAFKEGPGSVEPTVTSLLSGKRIEAHFYIRRVPMKDVPEGDEALAAWMHEIYQVKDQLAENFNNTGSFFSVSDVAAPRGYHVPRRCCSLINTAVWGLVVLVPMIYYLLRLLFSGSLTSFAIGAAIIATFSLTFTKLIGVTKISKGSQYGAGRKQD